MPTPVVRTPEWVLAPTPLVPTPEWVLVPTPVVPTPESVLVPTPALPTPVERAAEREVAEPCCLVGGRQAEALPGGGAGAGEAVRGAGEAVQGAGEAVCGGGGGAVCGGRGEPVRVCGGACAAPDRARASTGSKTICHPQTSQCF